MSRFPALFLLLLISQTTFVTTVVYADTTQDFSTPQTYQIKRNYTVDTQKLLMITAFYEGEYSSYYEKKYDTLAQIISSHWNVDISYVKEAQYRRSMVDDFDIIFYIKEDRELVPATLALDIARVQKKRVILSGFSHDIVSKIFGRMRVPTEDIAISNITYKNADFSKDMEIFLTFDTRHIVGLTTVTATFGTALHASSSSSTYPFAFTGTNSSIVESPTSSTYLVLPFVLPDYYATNSYSTIFLDLLYEGIGNHVAEAPKKALLRLEDVNVYTYHRPKKLRDVYEFLKSESVPFQIAFIVKYVDPIRHVEMRADEGRRFYKLLKQMVGEGYGTLIQHGYTHQIGTSVSGIGFEFWDEEHDAPLTTETQISVRERILSAQAETDRLRLPIPDIWETPHYAASDIAEAVFNDIYPIRYEHAKGVGSLPFPILLNGTIYIPENLGFVSDDSDDFVFGQDLDSIVNNLAHLNVFRDATASIFWHPWRDAFEVKFIVHTLKENGYTFVSPYTLIESVDETSSPAVTALKAYRANHAVPVRYILENIFIIAIYTFFIFGCLLYLRTIIRIKRYAKIFDAFNLTQEELENFAKAKEKKIPMFAIFVPARNEGLVIGNTVRRLANVDYPKNAYKVVVIVDERELDDEVEETTKSVVQRVGEEINATHQTELITYVEVPKWYSGVYEDFSENSQKSTKGRALNYALQTLEQQAFWEEVDMVCVLDADGRMHQNVLKEAAYKRISTRSHVLQGPVLQVSNFSDVSVVGIAAGIELAIHHLTELPHNLTKSRRVQFLAGTNYFIDKNLIAGVGGWDQNALVEDAELALRVYVKTGTRAEWIGSPEIEQTPKNFSIYKKQRRRWVRGHLELIKTIHTASIPFTEKLFFFWKIFVSQFRFIFDLGFPILALTFLFLGMFVDLGKSMAFISIILLCFAAVMWDLYGYMYRYLGKYIDPDMHTSHKIKMSYKLFFFSPVFMFVQSVPRILALTDYLRSAPVQWYKTERTVEKITHK